jgi:tetratricopeptide (TPR) repeat protein
MTSPQQPGTPYERGLTLLKQGQYAQAVTELTEAIRDDPSAPNPYVARALAYRALGDEAAARRDEDTARRLGGPEATAWDRLVNRAAQRLSGDLRHADRGRFYRSLEPLERLAVQLRELDCQILNGGLTQWVANGYGAWIDDVIAAAGTVGTPAARQVAAVLADVSQILRSRPAATPDADPLDRLLECDDRYYAVQDEFVRNVEDWLEKQSVRA